VRSIFSAVTSFLGDLFSTRAPEVVRRSEVRRSSLVPAGPDGDADLADFGVLVASVEGLVDDFRRGRRCRSCDVSFTVRYAPSGSDPTEVGVVSCRSCGSRNALRRGLVGSTCGTCGRSLEGVFDN